MNKKGLGEPLQIIASILLIFVVLVLGFIVFTATGSTVTTIRDNDYMVSNEAIPKEVAYGNVQIPYLIYLNGIYSDSLLSILNSKNKEYGDISNLIVTKDKDKIIEELKKLQIEIKGKNSKNLALAVYYVDKTNGKLVKILPEEKEEDDEEEEEGPGGKIFGDVLLPSYDGVDKIQVILYEV